MKKYTNPQLREMCKKQGIHNDHNFADGNVFIAYNPAMTGRASESASWSVTLAGMDLGQAWYDHGSRNFRVYSVSLRKEMLESAMNYVKINWPSVKEFARGPFGAYYKKSFVENRIAEIVSKHEKGIREETPTSAS